MSLSTTHTFLFSSLDSKQPHSARKVHLRRLYDLLQLNLQRQQFDRAQRIWAILVRCKEFDWKVLWTTGLQVLTQNDPRATSHTTIEYLRTTLLRYPEEREFILKELVTRLLLAGRHREALDELELYLPSFPYQDNPIFHTLASMTCLYLAQANTGTVDRGSIRDAKAHLDHAKKLDPDNEMFSYLVALIESVQDERPQQGYDSDSGDEDEKMVAKDEHEHDRKRIRI